MNPLVSIIIPTLNEADSIKKTLAALESFGEIAEIIVVDGGSDDATVSTAEKYNARILHSTRGRGTQMRAGAEKANGEVLWFLHADTVAPPDALNEILDALQNEKTAGGNFTICFDGERRAARFLTWLYPKLRRINLCYGDSAIFVRRDVYERVGGMREIPLFEDLDLFRRLSRAGEMINLSARVLTSSRRFEKKSFALTFARWSILQFFYWLGVNPHQLGKFYLPHKKK